MGFEIANFVVAIQIVNAIENVVIYTALNAIVFTYTVSLAVQKLVMLYSIELR